MDQFGNYNHMKADSYPLEENSDVVKTYYYWQLGKLYIGGVPIGGVGPNAPCLIGPGDDAWLKTVLCTLMKKRPSDGIVKTTVILT